MAEVITSLNRSRWSGVSAAYFRNCGVCEKRSQMRSREVRGSKIRTGIEMCVMVRPCIRLIVSYLRTSIRIPLCFSIAILSVQTRRPSFVFLNPEHISYNLMCLGVKSSSLVKYFGGGAFLSYFVSLLTKLSGNTAFSFDQIY